MEILTLARRANFGYTVSKRFNNIESQLKNGKSYRELVEASISLDRNQQLFHESAYLVGLVSALEAFVQDMAVEYLVRFPGHIKEKSMSFETLAAAGSFGSALEKMAEREVHSWSYKRFSEFAIYSLALYDKKSRFTPDLLEEIGEIKATRDIFVHANGRVNALYFEKAGSRARASEHDELTLGKNYLDASETAITRFIEEFKSAVPEKVKNMGRVAAFEAMWNATCLSEQVTFSKGWRIEKGDMIRPNDEGLEWAWAGSEKMLLDFFLGIYNKNYPTRQHDSMEALSRWPPATNEGKVMLSWFDSPFGF